MSTDMSAPPTAEARPMDLLRFATAGSVDDGKSTLIGRLLYDTKSLFTDQLAAVEAVSAARGDEYTNLALFTDGLRAEREQGITIDVAYRYFATPRRKFIIADTPGHTQYTRNMVYTAEAPGLFAAAARQALETAGVAASAVTHVVTASCTGFYAPGPDYRLVRDLDLPISTERYHLGFLGCAAAFPALRMASRICAAQPEAVVLVVCGELCTLHIRSSGDPEQIVASSVFADGAAAAVVSADPSQGSRHSAQLDLDRFATTLTSEGESDMAWIIGDAGFTMTLTAQVPRIIGREIRVPSRTSSSSHVRRAHRSTRGRCIRVGEACSTVSRQGSPSLPRRSIRRARCYAASATCPAPRCSSFCRASSPMTPSLTARMSRAWLSARGSRSNPRSSRNVCRSQHEPQRTQRRPARADG